MQVINESHKKPISSMVVSKNLIKNPQIVGSFGFCLSTFHNIELFSMYSWVSVIMSTTVCLVVQVS